MNLHDLHPMFSAQMPTDLPNIKIDLAEVFNWANKMSDYTQSLEDRIAALEKAS
jgi:hypothetical protein